ncbi:MAG: hypothetical protein IJE70_05035 [Oscillospiraceae bacterium]|nr:hypothetical protein [Oscillospiraceae bacterium]MBQ6902374.1 hypothetical protein [Oscillospiraceae bacterium]
MQTKRENYAAPHFEVIEIYPNDIITTSGGLIAGGNGDGDSSDYGDWGV